VFGLTKAALYYVSLFDKSMVIAPLCRVRVSPAPPQANENEDSGGQRNHSHNRDHYYYHGDDHQQLAAAASRRHID
jgi:hypothetical protein